VVGVEVVEGGGRLPRRGIFSRRRGRPRHSYLVDFFHIYFTSKNLSRELVFRHIYFVRLKEKFIC